MRILHVTLGNPNTHEGGLNRYCVDLMNVQRQLGADVYVLYPGRYMPNKSNAKIKHVSDNHYRIDNSLPIPITYGIDSPSRYMTETKISLYLAFLEKISVDIVHVHSFMGIHKEFFLACKQKNIKLVFTTHDYFPFCFKCNLINSCDSLCEGEFDSVKCMKCNNGGLSSKTQMLMQSVFYQSIKDNPILKKLKKRHKSGGSTVIENINDSKSSSDYQKLHEYYRDIMELIDMVHCNSEVSKSLYLKVFPNLRYRVVPITHTGITKRKHIRKDKNLLRISYFGGESLHKGYGQLKELISLLPNDNSWEINLYGGDFSDVINDPRVHPIGYFSKGEELSVWDRTDLLLFISQWPESFGFSVLEALANEIPVICSDLAGVSVLLDGVYECVYSHSEIIELLNRVKYLLNYENYELLQSKISQLPIDVDMSEHVKKIEKLYKEVLSDA